MQGWCWPPNVRVTVGHADSNGRSLGVIVGDWGIGRKVVTIGAGIDNACMMSWKHRRGIWHKFSCYSEVIIFFTQIRIIAINYICYPTPSGASVPTLVGVTATHFVGGSCIVLVTHGFVAESCAHVMLAASMAIRSTVVAGERHVGGLHWPRSSWRRHRGAG
jgi:hypothetical protein